MALELALQPTDRQRDPMKEKLLTVEDSFDAAGRGLIVVPVPANTPVRGPADLDIELRRPDGSQTSAVLSILQAFGQPIRPEPRWVYLIRELGKGDVPIGTEIWRDAGDLGRPPAAASRAKPRET